MSTGSRKCEFSIGERNFSFDGDNLAIYQIEENDTIPASEVGKCIKPFVSPEPYLRSVAFVLTNNCNLRCSYCYANQGRYDQPGFNMTMETARKGIDMLLTSVARHGGGVATVGFFGGEPLLRFDLVKTMVAYVKETCPDNVTCQYLITTNGTLFSPEIIDFMAENNFLVTLSIDGGRECHDLVRVYSSGKGSFDPILTNLPRLLNRLSVTARITVSNHNPMIDHVILDLHALGFTRITFAPDYNMSDEAFEIFILGLRSMFSRYQEDILAENYYDITNATGILIQLALRRPKRWHCNAGLAYFSLSADGQIYRCPRFTGLTQFNMGEVSNDKMLSKIDNSIATFKSSLGSAQARNKDCASCPFVLLCGGTCYHHAVIKSGSQFSVVERECRYRKTIFQEVIKLVCSLSQSERRALMLSLNAIWQKVIEK